MPLKNYRIEWMKNVLDENTKKRYFYKKLLLQFSRSDNSKDNLYLNKNLSCFNRQINKVISGKVDNHRALLSVDKVKNILPESIRVQFQFCSKKYGMPFYLVTPFDHFYPRSLFYLPDPPLYLIAGCRNIDNLKERCPIVSIYYSKDPSAYSRRVIAGILKSISNSNLNLWLALIEDNSKQMPIFKNEKNVNKIFIFSGGFLSSNYSCEKTSKNRIFNENVLISEFLPAAATSFRSKNKSNRLLTAFSDVLVVVESRLDSELLNLMYFTNKVGVDVWSVPGNIFDSSFYGSNRIIYEGANPLVDLREFISYLKNTCQSQ